MNDIADTDSVQLTDNEQRMKESRITVLSSRQSNCYTQSTSSSVMADVSCVNPYYVNQSLSVTAIPFATSASTSTTMSDISDTHSAWSTEKPVSSPATTAASCAHSYMPLSENSDEDFITTTVVGSETKPHCDQSEEWKCKFCPKAFSTVKLCISHEKNCDKFYVVPKKMPESGLSSPPSKFNKGNVKCKHCGKIFGLQKNCNRHEKSCVANPDTCSAFTCGFCGHISNRKDNYKAHLNRCEQKLCANKNERPLKPDEKVSLGTMASTSKTPKLRAKTPCMHIDCDQEFFHKNVLIEHLQNYHQESVRDPVTMKFDNEKSFITWKNQEEEQTFSYYSQKSGQSASKVKYFYCQHDGTSHTDRKTARVNNKGRIKVGHFCISKMQAWMDEEKKINIVYYPTHSHVCSSQDFVHHPVSQKINSQINEKLLWGISPTKILKDVLRKNISKTFVSEQIKNCKASVLSKKRIRERARKIREKRRFHKDEAKALMMMVNQLAAEDDCVIVYKPYKHKVVIGPKEIEKLPNSEDQFLLGLQTKRQAELLKEHSHKIVLVDETD